MNVTQYYGDLSFPNDLDALLVEEGPMVEELEIKTFGICIQFATRTDVSSNPLITGRRMTGYLDITVVKDEDASRLWVGVQRSHLAAVVPDERMANRISCNRMGAPLQRQ